MMTIGKITHKRIAGSSKSSAMMANEASFLALWVILMSRGETKKTDYVVLHEVYEFLGSRVSDFLFG